MLEPHGNAHRVPTLANRQSYFLRRERNLEAWSLVSPIWRLDHVADSSLVEQAAHGLLRMHEGLRLQGRMDPEGWAEHIADSVSIRTIVEEIRCAHRFGSNEFEDCINAAVADVRASFRFPGMLFRVLCIEMVAERASLIVLVAHHLLVDDHSFRVVIDDFFRLYWQLRTQEALDDSCRSASLQFFASRSAEFWTQKQDEELAYWQSLDWEQVRPLNGLPAGWRKDNLECFTRCSIQKVRIQSERHFLAEFYRLSGLTMIEVLLCAIADAYHDWAGSAMHLAMVFHGRSGVEKVDLSQTVGWISETVPLVLRRGHASPAHLRDAKAQLARAHSHGRSYGVLRYLSPSVGVRNQMDALPLPEISLNVKLRGRGYGPPAGSPQIVPWKLTDMTERDDTQRVFAVSGGAFFEGDCFCLSWDYSDRVINSDSVDEFSARCMARFIEYSQRIAGITLHPISGTTAPRGVLPNLNT